MQYIYSISTVYIQYICFFGESPKGLSTHLAFPYLSPPCPNHYAPPTITPPPHPYPAATRPHQHHTGVVFFQEFGGKCPYSRFFRTKPTFGGRRFGQLNFKKIFWRRRSWGSFSLSWGVFGARLGRPLGLNPKP